MKQFLTVFKFELRGQLQSKVFRVITILLLVVIVLTLNVGRLEALLGDSLDSLKKDDEATKIAVCNKSEMDTEALVETFKMFFGEGYEFSVTKDDNLEKQVEKGDVDTAIIIETPLKYKYIVETVGMFDADQQIIEQVLITNYRYSYLQNAGLTAEQITAALEAGTESDVVVTGKDQTQSFAYTYAIIMILYMVLLLYGQFVASSVAGEKSSRCMEVLITSAKPMNLMFGKVLGSGSAGLLQLVLILGTTVGCYQLNKNTLDNEMIVSLFGMPVSVAIYSIVFFILGYFIYAFMFGAAGSLASRAEDLGALVMPINVIFIFAFMVAIFTMTSGNVDGIFVTVCSFLPTFAPMLMLVRICMGTVAVWEIALSIAIQIATIILLGIGCAKVYRAGVLLYGNSPKFKDIWKILTTKQE